MGEIELNFDEFKLKRELLTRRNSLSLSYGHVLCSGGLRFIHEEASTSDVDECES